jgi:hypothetical protein
MKFWQLTVGLGVGFLLFMSVFTSENQKLLLLNNLNNPLANQPKLVQANEISTETQYFYTDQSQFLVIHSEGVLNTAKDEKKSIEIKSGDIFIAGGLESLELERIFIGEVSFEIQNKEVFVSIDPKRANAHIHAINGSLKITFPESNIPLFIPVGHKAIIPQDRYFLQQPNAFLNEELNRFFQVKPWYDTEKAAAIQTDKNAYKSWIERFENYTLNRPRTWSNGRETSLAALTDYELSKIQEDISIGLPTQKKHKYQLSRAMSRVVDGFYFFQQNKKLKQEQTASHLRELLLSPEWQRFQEEAPTESAEWNDYERIFRFWIRKYPQTSNERSLMEMFHQTDTSSIVKMEREWSDAENNLARFFLQKTTPHLSNLKEQSEKYQFNTKDLFFLEQKRYLLYRLLVEYPFFQKPDFFKLYDIWAQAEIRLTETEQSTNKKLQVATEIIDLVEELSQRDTDPKISQIILDLWERIEVETLLATKLTTIISNKDIRLIENLRLTGGQKIEEKEIKAIEETRQFEQELEKRLENLESALEINIDEKADTDATIENAPDLLDFFREQDVQSDLLNFRTSRETGTSKFEKFIYKDRFIQGEFEYDSQRFLVLNLSSGEEYESVSRSFFEGILKTIDASIAQEQKRLEEIQVKAKELKLKNKNKIVLDAPESAVTQTAEKAILSRRFSQRMLSTLPIELQRHNIMVLDDSYQMFGIWNASSGRAEKLAFTFDQVNGKFTDIKWVEVKKEVDEEKLYNKEETLDWEDFEDWLIELQPKEEEEEEEEELIDKEKIIKN